MRSKHDRKWLDLREALQGTSMKSLIYASNPLDVAAAERVPNAELITVKGSKSHLTALVLKRSGNLQAILDKHLK